MKTGEDGFLYTSENFLIGTDFPNHDMQTLPLLFKWLICSIVTILIDILLPKLLAI